jgi:hypothetical protein
LIVSSVAASLLGARLAALGDTQATSARPASNQVIVQTGGKTQIVEMPAIPTAISPDMLPPVARSSSSR